jgi:hypothetical protein
VTGALRMGLSVREALVACCLGVLIVARPAAAQDAAPEVAAQPAAAAEMKGPRISSVEIDWNAARAALAAFDQAPADAAAEVAAPNAFVRLNAATTKTFPKIAASGVPVLLPFDTRALLRDQAQGTAGDATKYLSDFHAPTFFYPGPSGYDAAFSLQPQDTAGLDLTFARRVEVQISASALIYELDGPTAADGSPVKELESEFPGIRRVILESRLRYAFVRFDVPYVVSIGCFDGAKGARHLSCREADRVAVRFLKALNLTGGAPQDGAASEPAKTALPTLERPDKASPDFTYYAAGDILPGTGVQGRSGEADTTVYAKIRFPMAHAPAYTNSQSFMNWGNCDLTGRVALGGSGKDASYRCRVNEVPLLHDEAKNYAYPWRDNFCEHRYYYVTQCPAGLGHQGEDIRPSSCKLRNDGADRCEPYQDDVVAVRDGVALRTAGDEALYLVVDVPDEHIRFRYLHMNPHMLDAAGMVSGHELTEGDVLGPVGDYGKREGGTTYHLHFDMQVPTRQGWLFVNPYTTLVAAYERLIGGRGQIVKGTALASSAALGAGNVALAPNSAATSPAKDAATSNPSPADGSVQPGDRAERAETDAAPKSGTARERRQRGHQIVAEHCQTRFAKGHRRRVCRTDVAESRERGRHARAVRSVDRRFSRQSTRARHRTGDLHPRHERG